MLVAAAPTAAADRAHPPVPVGNPGDWFGAAAYPPAALRAGAQGRVAVRVNVDAAGRPTACTVAESSGSSDLDEATCRIAQTRMTFTPATDARGNAVAGDYHMAIRWKMPTEAVPPPAPAGAPVPGQPDDAPAR